MSVSIIGIDPGLAKVGYGIVKINKNKIETVTYGYIYTPSTLSKPERLTMIRNKLSKVIKKNKPNEAAVEEIYLDKNAKTAMDVREAKGIITELLSKNKVEVFVYTAPEVKKSVGGHGRSKKNVVRNQVKKILGLEGKPIEVNASDALAIAIHHVKKQKHVV